MESSDASNLPSHNKTQQPKQQSNPNKRKLSGSQDDENHPKKKRKLNENSNIKQKVQRQLNALKQERDHFKKGMTVYKEAMHYYKEKYLKIVFLLQPVQTRHEIQELELNTNDDDDSTMLSVDHQSSIHSINEIQNCDPENKTEDSEDDICMPPQDTFDCHVCGSTQPKVDGQMDGNEKWHCISCWMQLAETHETGTDKSESDNDNAFERSYHISVACHRCNHPRFDDLWAYRAHLRQHYPTEILNCDLDEECKTPITSLCRLAEHIASHTKEYPYKCNHCNHATATKSNLKSHWSTQHKHPKRIRMKKRSRKPKPNDNEMDHHKNHNNAFKQHSTPVILCSGLSEAQKIDYERFKKQFRNVATFVDQWNRTVTHLVTTAELGTRTEDDAILSSRTMKYFQSVLAGCWVLCFDWVHKCLAKKRFIHKEKSYQVLGDRKGRGACIQARQLRKNKKYKGLFGNVSVFIDAEFKHTKLDDELRTLFETGGAEIMRMSISDMDEYKNKTAGKIMVFVYDKSEFDLSAHQVAICREFGILSIGLQDVFDRISKYKAISRT